MKTLLVSNNKSVQIDQPKSNGVLLTGGRDTEPCNDNKCINNKYLQKDNYLSEFETEYEKNKVRENLGINSEDTLKWGNIKGSIENQEDIFEAIDLSSKESYLQLNKGRFYPVNTLTELHQIPESIRKNGMLAYVVQTKTYYRLEDGFWVDAKFGGESIPIYDQELLDKLKDDLPSKYITIPNKDSDLNGYTESREISKSGTYVDILFSAIRKLQSEVAKLKNSFNYGIYSYTGKNTAMSRVIDGIENPDDEPLWCIEPEDLSEVLSVVIGEGSGLEPLKNVDTSKEGVLKITGTAYWEDIEDIKLIEDPKLFVYFTVSSLNVIVKLLSIDNDELEINLANLNVPSVSAYNVMICISRNEKNYIYISIGNATRDKILLEGYYKNGIIQDNITYQDHSFYFKSLYFTDLNLSKLDFYSKYQDFSSQVIPSTPSDEDYKYKVAHITIRSVESENVLESIKSQLPNNELIFVENTKKLWIKNNDNLINIGSSGGSSTDTGMTRTEVIDLLKEMGIVREEGQNLEINDLASLTFIHEGTKNKFKLTIDNEGNLLSQKVPNNSELLKTRLNVLGNTKNHVRGFIGQLRLAERNKDAISVLNESEDIGIYADRVKIGAFYTPLDTDTIHGCSRGFVELENTADCDFALTGCYLHYTTQNENGDQIVYSLPLTGTLKAGGTYLIVGKYYSDINDKNTFIKVTSFDQEWYVNGELIDFTTNSSKPYGFALTYGNEFGESKSPLTATTKLAKETTDGDLSSLNINGTTKVFPYLLDANFIDSIYINNCYLDNSGKAYWTAKYKNPVKLITNSMYKNMFELDPAKQAFQSTNTKDSSRTRWQNNNDVWVLDLSKEFIQFPFSKDIYFISNFTPKASYENKNVSTDKSKLDSSKPNMVTCSFGLNIHTTRCFNWISVGKFDEYIWIRKRGETEWKRFESYKEIETPNELSNEFPRRKEYSVNSNNIIYSRIVKRFPGCNTLYTAHKCVIELTNTAPSSTEVWEYVVGTADVNGNQQNVSDIQTFTLHPITHKPVIYQITDQQGFHWVEYQVWAAAANKVLEQINLDSSKDNIIPILINTGDMTQNGTRINEWLDYYNAGRSLFSQYEQMNVVGNNDLCGTNVEELGTGDDVGKSNSFYFHVFYCYDVDETNVPIVNNKYIPSLYYFDSNNFRFIMINSEITAVNCKEWYGLADGTDFYNIYTGWKVDSSSNSTYINDDNFTSIYTMIYRMLNRAGNKKCIAVCHEMPFTVITQDSLSTGNKQYSRSLNGTSLVGSHCNQINSNDNKKGTYWLSRLLEYFGVKLCLGGHKHTYACTYPLREYFKFGEYDSLNNYNNYQMDETLENDNVVFKWDNIDHSKLPLTKRDNVGEGDGQNLFYPYTPVNNLTNGVVYFMCQATGYKLTSNKELPSPNQKFSMIVPKTDVTGSSPAANDNQKRPMFGVIRLTPEKYSIYLVRIEGIFNNKFKFNQTTYNSDSSKYKIMFLMQKQGDDYGDWKTLGNETEGYSTIQPLLEITL